MQTITISSPNGSRSLPVGQLPILKLNNDRTPSKSKKKGMTGKQGAFSKRRSRAVEAAKKRPGIKLPKDTRKLSKDDVDRIEKEIQAYKGPLIDSPPQDKKKNDKRGGFAKRKGEIWRKINWWNENKATIGTKIEAPSFQSMKKQDVIRLEGELQRISQGISIQAPKKTKPKTDRRGNFAKQKARLIKEARKRRIPISKKFQKITKEDLKNLEIMIREDRLAPIRRFEKSERREFRVNDYDFLEVLDFLEEPGKFSYATANIRLPLNRSNIQRLKKVLKGSLTSDDISQNPVLVKELFGVENIEELGSDAVYTLKITKQIMEDEPAWLIRNQRVKRRLLGGAFFPYTHKISELNLERYGIFTSQGKAIERYQNGDNCLIIALIESGVIEEEGINEARSLCNMDFITVKSLKNISEAINCCFKLTKWVKTRGKTQIIGDENNPLIEIGLLDKHYFLLEDTEITKLALKDYFEISKKGYFDLTINRKSEKEGKTYYYTSGKITYANSFQVIHFLLEHKDKYLQPVKIGRHVVKKTTKNDYDCLGYYFTKNTKLIAKEKERKEEESPKEKKRVNKKRKKEEKKEEEYDENSKLIWFADFETCPDTTSHRAYLLCIRNESGSARKTFMGFDCAEKARIFFKNHPVNNHLVIFHNLRYDFTHFMQEVEVRNWIKTGGSVKAVESVVGNTKITFKDSFALIPAALRKFGKMFKLEMEKEIMPYEAYKENTIKRKKRRFIPEDEIRKMWFYNREEEADRFLEECEYYSILEDGVFDFEKYHEVRLPLTQKNNRMLYSEISNQIYPGVELGELADTWANELNLKEPEYRPRNRGIPQPHLWHMYAPDDAWDTCPSDPETDDDDDVFASDFADQVTFESCASIPINDALEYIKSEEDKEQFLQNLEKFDVICGENNERFDHIKYAEYYCKRDIDLLCEGYCKYREWMKNITGINVDNVISLPSLVSKFYKKKGCYDGVYQLASIPRAFISEAVVGGRCATRDNKKWHVTAELQDFDGVSLYPSAMRRMPGLLKGIPKELGDEELNMDFLNSVDGYFIKIKIDEVHKRRHMPLISYIDEKRKVRVWTNDYRGEMFVSKIALEDLIEFHQIEFTILQGYYFNQGRNPKIGDCAKLLFDERRKKGAEKNPIEMCYKQMMNSAYGKMIEKPRDTDYVFKKDCRKDGFNEFESFFARNSESIIEAECITHPANEPRRFAIKVKQNINKHFSMPHCGAEVLDFSKRIMNEIVCLAEDLGIFIAYTDTDSIHIDANRINELADAYKGKYGRELIGEEMGQANCDFKFGQDKGTLPVSIESIFLGKKAYIDKVKFIKDGEEQIGFHIRMKGIDTSILAGKEDPFEYYKQLFNGESKTENLCQNKPHFVYPSLTTVKTLEEMNRTISFKGDRWVFDGEEEYTLDQPSQ